MAKKYEVGKTINFAIIFALGYRKMDIKRNSKYLF